MLGWAHSILIFVHSRSFFVIFLVLNKQKIRDLKTLLKHLYTRKRKWGPRLEYSQFCNRKMQIPYSGKAMILYRAISRILSQPKIFLNQRKCYFFFLLYALRFFTSAKKLFVTTTTYYEACYKECSEFRPCMPCIGSVSNTGWECSEKKVYLLKLCLQYLDEFSNPQTILALLFSSFASLAITLQQYIWVIAAKSRFSQCKKKERKKERKKDDETA